MQVETTAVTYAQTESGVRLICNSGDDMKVKGFDNPGTHQYRIVGSKGMITFWGFGDEYEIVNGAAPEGKRIEVEPYPESAHQLHLDNLAGMIASGEHDFSGAESSLMALEICEAAYRSSQHRCRIDMPLSDFRIPEPSDWQPGQPWLPEMGGRNGRQLDDV